MKIRWTREAVRFRISPSELKALQDGAMAREELSIGPSQWRASIVPSEGTTELTLQDGELRLDLGADDLNQLSQPEAEGVYFQREESGATLRFYIEKDFPCVHPRATEAMEQTETFSPPPGFAERKTE